MKNLEKELNDLVEFAKQKVLSGDFEFIELIGRTAVVKIADDIKALVFISDRPKQWLSVSAIDFNRFKISTEKFGDDLGKFESDEQRLLCYSYLEPFLIQEKKQEIKDLKTQKTK